MINLIKTPKNRKDFPVGYIYRIIDRKNGKTYIGLRTLSRDSKGWRHYLSSSKIIEAIIEKDGKDRLVKEFICYSWSQKELVELEYKFIKLEWLKGKGEYNLTAYTPNPYFWMNKTSKEKALIREKQRESIKNLMEENTYENPSHLAALKRYKNFLHDNDMDAIVSDYRKIGSIRKVAKNYSISAKYLKKFLEENNIPLNHQNLPNTPKSDEIKKSISNGLNRYYSNSENIKYNFICVSCGLKNFAPIANKKKCDNCKLIKKYNKDSNVNNVKPEYFKKFILCQNSNCHNYFYNPKSKFCQYCESQNIVVTKKELDKIERDMIVDKIVTDPKNIGKSIRDLAKEYNFSNRIISIAFDRNSIKKLKPGDTSKARTVRSNNSKNKN